MTEIKRKEMLILADAIQGEINRMCVTDNLAELDHMEKYAVHNIRKLRALRFRADFDRKE